MPIRCLFTISLLLLFACSTDKEQQKLVSLVRLDPLHSSRPYDSLDISSRKLFDILTEKTTGLEFSNNIRMSYEREFWSYSNLFNGGGIAVGDINRDGLPDVYFTGNAVEDKLFLNKGALKFEEISQKAGILKDDAWSTGVTMVDINSDGYLDIYVCQSWHPKNPEMRRNAFYINNGDMTFSEKAIEMGLADTSFTTHASFFDYDRDGDLDVYVLNHPTDWNDRRKYNNHEKIERGINQSDHLYRNNGNLQFENVSRKAGINNHGYGLSVTVADINQDGWPDILVTNDWGMQDHIYINQQDGSFVDESPRRFTKHSFSSMGSDIADINQDGFYDMTMAELDFKDNRQHKSFSHARLRLSELRTMEHSGYYSQYFRNALQLNNGDGTFLEIASAAGTASTDWSWAMLFLDADNDSWQDLFVTNGNYRTTNLDERPRIQQLRAAARRKDKERYEEILTTFDTVHIPSPNTIFKNNGDLTFTNKNSAWGTNLPTISHGAAYADLDQDGDMDILTNNMNQPAFLYRNNATQLYPENHYLQITFSGPPGNISGFGAEVILRSGRKQQKQFLTNARGFQSSSEFMLHFGLGQNSIVDQLEVIWPDQKRQLLNNIKANQRLTIHYKDAKNIPASVVPNKAPIFTETKDKSIVFTHHENDHDDFYRNRLIHKMYSMGGPAIAVGDINNDGLDDCYIGGAVGQAGKLFVQTPGQNFNPVDEAVFENDKLREDMGALFFDADQDNDLDLYVVSGGSEYFARDSLLQDRLYLNDGQGRFQKAFHNIPKLYESGSVVTAADFDRDGDLDLFVGGRIRSGYYPEAPTSMLLQNDQGRFTDVTDQWAPGLKNVGMVTAALWTDVDNDQVIDLIVVGEWMPIRLFKNTGESFKEISEEVGLGSSSGWWNSIAAADFDQDGDMDYVLGNQGENLRYKPENGYPLELYYGDFDSDNDIDLVYSYYYYGKRYPITYLDDLAGEMAFIGEKFSSYTRYGMSTTEEVLGKKRFKKAGRLQADIFASCYLENKEGQQFELHRLPQEAQLSVVNGLVVNDFDQDGKDDVLLHGNYFAYQPQYEKQDAITGLLLKGNGDGTFRSIRSIESGFYNWAEGRALAQLSTGLGQEMVVAGVCDGPVKSYSYQTEETWAVPIGKEDCAALIRFKDGSHKKVEFYYGQGYLSQNSRQLKLVPDNIDQVLIYNYLREQRTLKPQ